MQHLNEPLAFNAAIDSEKKKKKDGGGGGAQCIEKSRQNNFNIKALIHQTLLAWVVITTSNCHN